MRIARNVVADHLRRQREHPGLETYDLKAPEDTGDQARERTREGIGLWLCAAVERLPSPYREAICMTEIGRLTQAQAAARVGLSVSGMKSRVQRGRAMLADLLRECCVIVTDHAGRFVDATPRTRCC